VEALLAPLSTAWQRMATVARSHLSPDGGSVTRAAVHRLAADGYGLAADGYGLAADGYGSQRMDRFGEVFLKYIAKSGFRTLDLARYLQ
jgi:hypothetical protein